MKRFFIAGLLAITPMLAAAQCTNTPVPVADVILTDTNQHVSGGGHSASTGIYDFSNPTPPSTNSTNIQATCNYTAPSSGNTCNTSCSVSFAGGGSTSERGALNAVGTHNIYTGTATGQASGAGTGATCTGAFAGGAANCGPGGCQGVSLGVTVSGGVVGVSFSGLGGGTDVWHTGDAIPVTCPSRLTTSGGGGGGGGVCDTNCPPCTSSTLLAAAATGPINDVILECDPGTSPIIVDTEAEGFHLTSAADGVSFDISGTGHPIQIAWTDSRFRNAFLVLPGPDGLVHSGQQLFGNVTPQPASPSPNGFIALAQYDLPQNGGNADGVIDEKDTIFSRLRLWIDENHDGVCQPSELHTLQEFGIYSLALSYFQSSRIDQYGNLFRFRGRIDPGALRDPRDVTPSGDPGRWAYDVFLVTK